MADAVYQPYDDATQPAVSLCALELDRVTDEAWRFDVVIKGTEETPFCRS